MDPNNPNTQNFDNSNQVPPTGPSEMANSYAAGVPENEATSTQYAGVPEMATGAQDMPQNMAQDMPQGMAQDVVMPETDTNVAVPMAGLTDASMANPPLADNQNPLEPTNPGEPSANPGLASSEPAPGLTESFASTSAANVTPNPAENNNGFANAAPIMMPDTEPKPPTTAEELKSPFKAADPVQGSIGSAFSGGNAAASAANQAASQTNQPAIANKKKSSKKNIVILSVIAAIVVIALIAILVMQATGML